MAMKNSPHRCRGRHPNDTTADGSLCWQSSWADAGI